MHDRRQQEGVGHAEDTPVRTHFLIDVLNFVGEHVSCEQAHLTILAECDAGGRRRRLQWEEHRIVAAGRDVVAAAVDSLAERTLVDGG